MANIFFNDVSVKKWGVCERHSANLTNTPTYSLCQWGLQLAFVIVTDVRHFKLCTHTHARRPCVHDRLWCPWRRFDIFSSITAADFSYLADYNMKHESSDEPQNLKKAPKWNNSIIQAVNGNEIKNKKRKTQCHGKKNCMLQTGGRRWNSFFISNPLNDNSRLLVRGLCWALIFVSKVKKQRGYFRLEISQDREWKKNSIKIYALSKMKIFIETDQRIVGNLIKRGHQKPRIVHKENQILWKTSDQ